MPAAIIAPNPNHFTILLLVIWSSSRFSYVRLCRTVSRHGYRWLDGAGLTDGDIPCGIHGAASQVHTRVIAAAGRLSIGVSSLLRDVISSRRAAVRERPLVKSHVVPTGQPAKRGSAIPLTPSP